MNQSKLNIIYQQNEQNKRTIFPCATLLTYMKTIAVDLGATSGRVMCIDHSNGRFFLEEDARFLNKTYTNSDGYLCWDFSYLLNNVIEGIKTALKKNPDAESIGIDTWGVDYGFLDKDGKLIHDPYCYRDNHSFETQKSVLNKISFEKIYSICGIQNLHFNTIYQLAGDPTNFNNVETFLMIPDLIAYFLTGEKRLEETNASTTSLYSKKDGKMSKELLDAINIPERIFPKLIKAGDTYGYLKKEFLPEGVNKNIKVIASPTHDTASAVLGSNGEGEFAYISSGTWSLIGTELKEPLTNDKARKYNFTNEIGYGDTVRFLKNTMGMFLINEIRNDYERKGNKIPVNDIVPLVTEAKDIPALIDVNDPIFEEPGDMLNKLDTYLSKTNQAKPSTPGETMKLIYKSMAVAYKKIIANLEEITEKKINSILVVGGGNQAEILNQYLANECKIDVIIGASEATILGNALSQFIALGEISNVIEGRKDIGNSISSKIYHPLG